jgi:hypothetical protein
MNNVLSRFFSRFFKKEPPARYVVELLNGRTKEWECVSVFFATHQAGVDYAKQNYVSAWQANMIRVVRL